jgi:IS5 family transposase
MKQKYKKLGDHGLFGEQFRLEKISKHGDPLERLITVIDWSIFSPILELVVAKEKKSNAGAKPYPPLLMFKILILQRYYNLSDSQIEYQVLDRLSFCRFLGLTLSDKVPDEKTVWDFRERITNQGVDEKLFQAFHTKLEENYLIAHEGKIVDASFIEMPRQRNKKDENKHIKETGTCNQNKKHI